MRTKSTYQKSIKYSFFVCLASVFLISWTGSPALHKDTLSKEFSQENLSFNSIDFGDIKSGKTTVLNPGKDFDVEGYGRMFCHHLGSDEGRFVYVQVKGDFDISVRLESIHNDAAALTEAGLMVRKSLDPTSLLMSMAVTNNEYQSEGWPYTFMYRLVPGGFAGLNNEPSRNLTHGEKTYGNSAFGCSDVEYFHGNMSTIPRPMPNVWVRLTKVGDRYTGYRKENNGEWVKLGDYTLNMGEDLYVGLFISGNHHGGNKDTRSVVKFRDVKITQ